MPLLNPLQIHKVLEEAGVKKAAPSDLKELLEANSLGPEDLIQELGSMARSAIAEPTRLKALEMGMRLNGMLQTEAGSNVPIVNIIIRDSQNIDINPILIPRR